MTLQQIAHKKYIEFSNYKGSQNIASEFSIYKILEIVKLNRITNILELGLGIGTLPSAILYQNDRKINYSGTEANQFCLNSLSENVNSKNLKIYRDLDSVRFQKKFQLIIIDGKDSNLRKIDKYISKNGVIMIEGDRKTQQETITNLFPKALFVHMISSKKNNPNGVFDKSNWQGGIKVFFVNPTFEQKINWLKQKIRTKIVYQKRKVSN